MIIRAVGYSLLLVSLLGCKKANSTLKGDTQCPASEIASLKSRIAEIEGKSDNVGLALDSSDGEELLYKYSAGHASSFAGFQKIFESAPYHRWDEDLRDSCISYAEREAVKLCNSRPGAKCWSWMSFGKIDKNSEHYVAFHKIAFANCFKEFKAYVDAKSAPGTQDSTPSQGDQTPTPNPLPDSPGGGPDSGETKPETPDSNAEELKRLKAELERCQNEVTEEEFASRCDKAGGKFSRYKPYECICASGKPVETDPVGSCPKVADSSGPAKKPDQPDKPAKPADPVPPKKLDPEPAKPTVPACECKKIGTQCSKVVDGKVVKSLTPFMNTTIGKQETCDPSGAGGYENLCNQPTLKCP